ncbi:MAG: DUF1549 domain-containing protein [Planctomycetota bacterium]|nr:MAG: DUF1549 domain-containing protein [Planctomycetota bacterium]
MARLRITAVVTGVLLSVVSARAELQISPAVISLDRPEGSQQILVTEVEGDRRRDVTREARYEIAAPAIARIAADGLLRPVTEGTTQLTVKFGDKTLNVPITVSGLQKPVPVSFSYEVLPLLTKGRCNAGGCHGKAEGQNGFKLSLFGFDAAADHDAIFKEAKGRRLTLTNPAASLMLLKGTATMPHGGGRKIEPNSPAEHRLRRWIAEGAEFVIPPSDGKPVERQVVGIEVEPAQVVIAANGTQQLRVTAIDDAGGKRCATVEADYISNATHIADINTRGLLQASDVPGEAAILVRYLGHVAVCRAVMPRPGSTFARPAENNFIDKHVWDKLTRLGISPSEPIDDATFIRRTFLDVIGSLPTAAEARAFIADASANKRAKLVDALLQRPEYAEYWAMKWSDLLKADKLKITPQGTVGLTRWLRKQFTANRPYNEMVHEILTIQGPTQSESPASFFKTLDTPEVTSRAVSQLFLGVRIECAQCHHHPSERWSQDDYAGLAGFFSGTVVKKLPDGTDAIVARAGTDQKHPRTGELIPARALGAKTADFTNVIDRRLVLANWMTAPDNPFVTKAIANRLWAHYFGRGLVEPIDDNRATNPATNEPLLAALEAHLKEVKYDLKAFTRTLLLSRAYQLGSAIDANRDDRQHFSHARPKTLPAEVLLDAISQTTGVPEKFNGWPDGVRSIQVWDNRMPSYFFRIFGRPVRATVCECERSNEPSISQALHLLNSPEVHAKLTHRHGLARKLAATPKSNDELVDEIYLSTLTRFPTAEEKVLMAATFEAAGANRHQAVEDVLWAVLNTKEFLYNH